MEHNNMTVKEADLYLNDIRNEYLNRKNHIQALNLAKAALESVDAMKKRFMDGILVHCQGTDADDGIECPFCGYEVARNDGYIEMRPKHCPECGTKLIY